MKSETKKEEVLRKSETQKAHERLKILKFFVKE